MPVLLRARVHTNHHAPKSGQALPLQPQSGFLLPKFYFARFLDGPGEGGRRVMGIDDETPRRSSDRAAGVSSLHVLTAFGCNARPALGQAAVRPGGDEITAARALLGLLDPTSRPVTGDAVHRQAETAALVEANRPLTARASPSDKASSHRLDNGNIAGRSYMLPAQRGESL